MGSTIDPSSQETTRITIFILPNINFTQIYSTRAHETGSEFLLSARVCNLVEMPMFTDVTKS